jgi:integrase
MVFFDKNAVTIGRSIARETGGQPFLYENAKTEESKRTIVIPKRAMQIIERRLDARPWTKEGAIFPDPLGMLYFPGKVEQLWARHRTSVGFPTFTSHGFRKSVATMLDEAGMSPRDIAEYLGHTKPSMTMDVYMDLNKQSAKMADVIEGKFGVSSESVPPKGAKVA